MRRRRTILRKFSNSQTPSPASVSSSHVCDCTGLGLHPLGKSESLFFMLFFLEDEVHYLILWSGLQGLRSAVYVVWPFVVEGHYFHILREPGSSQMTNNIIRRLWRTRFLHAQRGVLLWKIWEKTDTSHLRNQAPASCWESLHPEIKYFNGYKSGENIKYTVFLYGFVAQRQP